MYHFPLEELGIGFLVKALFNFVIYSAASACFLKEFSEVEVETVGIQDGIRKCATAHTTEGHSRILESEM